MKRSAPLTRGKPLRRRKPIAPANKKRRADRRAIAFGERAPLVREMRCVAHQPWPWGAPPAWRRCEGEIEAAHVRSRGAGGDRRDLVPLCSRHHRQQHDVGIETFQKIYALNLGAHAARVAAELDARGIP